MHGETVKICARLFTCMIEVKNQHSTVILYPLSKLLLLLEMRAPGVADSANNVS
jgi:hypothetical protein